MMRGRFATALYVLVLALAGCGLVATHARTVPATAGGVVRAQATQEASNDAIADSSFGTGRVLTAKSTAPACADGTNCGLDLGLPYVPPTPCNYGHHMHVHCHSQRN